MGSAEAPEPMRFGAVRGPWWDDRRVFIVGGGSSLTGYDLSGLRSRGRVLGVNRVADLVDVDASFSLDHNFIKNRQKTLAKWAVSQEVFVAVSEDYRRNLIPGVTYLERRLGKGWSTDRQAIHNGGNSGFGALNLALLKRARTIYLLGIDLVSLNRDQPVHWHDGYHWTNRSTVKYFPRWASNFDEIAESLPPGVQVLNANPDSGVKCFPFTTYEDLGL